MLIPGCIYAMLQYTLWAWKTAAAAEGQKRGHLHTIQPSAAAAAAMLLQACCRCLLLVARLGLSYAKERLPILCMLAGKNAQNADPGQILQLLDFHLAHQHNGSAALFCHSFTTRHQVHCGHSSVGNVFLFRTSSRFEELRTNFVSCFFVIVIVKIASQMSHSKGAM